MSEDQGKIMAEMLRELRAAEARAHRAEDLERYLGPPRSDELVREALGILTNLHDNIAKHGNYSAESTMVFVDQAASCLREALA